TAPARRVGWFSHRYTTPQLNDQAMTLFDAAVKWGAGQYENQLATCIGAADGTSCSDGNPCNGLEACVQGQCHAGMPTACPESNACATYACVPATGECVATYAPSGATCTDDNVCTTGDACDGAGACASSGTTSCNDNNPCTQDRCDPQLGCRASNVADGTVC